MTSIAQQSWLQDAATQAVMQALEAIAPGCARFVGGCVRNSLMGKAVDDIDIATQLTPDAVMGAAQAAGLSVHPTGLAHGTVTIVAHKTPFEVTTLRRDIETDGRHAKVAFTTDWTQDALRRDFRMNALYADGEGQVFDPTGGGLADIKAGRVSFIGEPQARIREDYLRILRFFRFSAWYGADAIDAEGAAACAAMTAGLQDLSRERIWKEWKKLFAAEDPRAAIAAMRATGVLEAIAPQAVRDARFAALVELESQAFLPADALRRTAAILPDHSAGVVFCESMKVSHAERDRLLAALGDTPRIVSYLSMRELRRALYALGVATFQDRAFLAWAQEENHRTSAQWRALLALAAGWTPPVFGLSGADVTTAGVAPGPKIGAILREVEAWWIDADFPDDKLALVERLKAVAQALG